MRVSMYQKQYLTQKIADAVKSIERFEEKNTRDNAAVVERFQSKGDDKPDNQKRFYANTKTGGMH